VKLIPLDDILKQCFPADGVLTGRAKELRDWRRRLEQVGARVAVSAHRDNTDLPCRNVGSALVYDMRHHDCCHQCNEEGERYDVGFDEEMPSWL
jgi:hypothetical protein